MRTRHAISSTRWLFCLLAGMLIAVISRPASAGTAQVRDAEGLFTPADISALRGAAQSTPFDVRVLTNEAFPSKPDFDRYVGEQVSEPNMVVVGIDRVHRHTSVHFGNGLGVAPSQYRSIEQAGNESFRAGNWRAGVEAILEQTKSFAHPAQLGTGSEPVRSIDGGTLGLGFGTLLLIGGLVMFVAYTLWRRARASGPNQPGYPGPYGGGYGGYGGGSSGLGGNIASAGLGGLVGYELGKAAGEHESEHYRDRAEQADVTRRDDRGDFDAGGASGGWDDDQGGGGDWGGGGGDGGGDSGGGGSDW